MKGLRLTRRGEAVRDTLFVILGAAAFFPAMSLIILTFRALGA
jgi:hypothetical protein